MIYKFKPTDYPDLDWEELYDDAEIVQEKYQTKGYFSNQFLIKISNEVSTELAGAWITNEDGYWWSHWDGNSPELEPPEFLYRAEERTVKTREWFIREQQIGSASTIYRVGTKNVLDIFNYPVEITEKVDGSQFCFGWVNGKFQVRSKEEILPNREHNQMFNKAYDYVTENLSTAEMGNITFHCEYLRSKRHNHLCYGRAPKNNLVLFSAIKENGERIPHHELTLFAKGFGIDIVPLLYEGKITEDELDKFLEIDSFLGGVKIEGVVIKSYDPFHAVKYVSQKYKEVSSGKRLPRQTPEEFKESFKTEARWNKAVQHLRDNDELSHTTKDIGKLKEEINRDLLAEEEEYIDKFLARMKKDILKNALSEFGEWYIDNYL